MRRLKLFLLAFMASLSMLGQNRLEQNIKDLGEPKRELTLTQLKSVEHNYKDVVSYAELLDVDTHIITRDAPDYFKLKLKYKGENLDLKLFKSPAITEDFYVLNEKQERVQVKTGAVLTYKGVVGNSGVASLSVYKDNLFITIGHPSYGNIVVAPLDGVKGHIIYEEQNMLIKNTNSCSTEEQELPLFNPAQAKIVAESIPQSNCVKVYLEVDNDIYKNKVSSVQQTTNWTISLFNHVQTLFANDGISISLKSVLVWTTADPYNGTTASMNLQRFKNNRPVFDGDVGQLLSVEPGSFGGVAAGINTLCSTNNYAYSDVNQTYNTVPTYSWSVQVVTHEFGHLLGSPHTHACVWNGNNTAIDNCGSVAIPTGEGSSCKTTPSTLPSSTQKGSIMSYCHLVSAVGISFNNGFGEQPRNRIIQAINNTNCIGISCNTSCINGVLNVRQLESNNTTLKLEWDDLSDATNYKVWVAPYNINASWETVQTNNITKTGLQPNTYYRVRIKPDCGDLDIFYREFIFATGADWCQGVVITDSGGEYINYFNNEDIKRTIKAPQGRKIKINFTQFDVHTLGNDFLHVYKNDSLVGSYRGTTLPPTIEAEKVTLHFVSDNVTTRAGYKATVTCTEASIQERYYRDVDGDGYGNSNIFVDSYTPISGYVLVPGDCNDNNPNINPGVAEILYNGIDDNCDGNLDEGNRLTVKLWSVICNAEIKSRQQPLLTVDYVPGVTAYKFKVRIVGHMFEYGVTSTSGIVYPSTFGIQVGDTFYVSIQLQINGVWLGYYGEECMLTLTGIPVTVFPNAFKTSFNLKTQLEGTHRIYVYDLQGRLVEQLTTEDITTAQLGEKLSVGVYNVFVEVNGITEVIKIIKEGL